MEAVAIQAARTKPRSKRWRVFVVLFVIALLSFIPIRVDRLKKRLERSMSAALGRGVTVQSIDFHVLPAPGFDLKEFSIEDDPAFSSEPLLRADTVDASLRLSSLWGARIEIAGLSLKEPSLNLVRDAGGRWNLDGLLNRATQIPSAPTTMKHAEARPRFPYIEATQGRINFKLGPEKKLFAFTDADFALWLASENQWKARMTARPMRTDANLGDTGMIRASGSFERALDLRSTPIRLEVTWNKAQLGELTHLIFGRDKGWRGGVTVNAGLEGTPSDLKLSSVVAINDLRRYDIAAPDSLNVMTKCGGHYAAELPRGAADGGPLPAFTFWCDLRRDQGALQAFGTVFLGTPERVWRFETRAIQFPVSSLADFARHAKRGIPEDLRATGYIDGMFNHCSKICTERILDNGRQIWTGTASNVRISSAMLGSDFALGTLAINFDRALEPPPYTAKAHKISKNSADPPEVVITPFGLALGGASPAIVTAKFTAKDYKLEINGEADVERLQSVLRSFGLPEPEIEPATTGKANIDLQISGAWAGFASPVIAGIVRPLPTARARAAIR